MAWLTSGGGGTFVSLVFWPALLFCLSAAGLLSRLLHSVPRQPVARILFTSGSFSCSGSTGGGLYFSSSNPLGSTYASGLLRVYEYLFQLCPKSGRGTNGSAVRNLPSCVS